MHVKKQGCFYKNKNGDIRVSLTELMMSLLAIAVIVLMVYVGVRLVSMFSSSKDYDSTIASFDVLGERVDELIEDKNYANKNILYYLNGEYLLVGYDYKEASVAMEDCDGKSLTGSRKQISRICGKSCLCIYGKDDLDKIPLKCKSFDKNIVFLAPSNQKPFCSINSGWNPEAYKDYYPADRNYKFLVLEGFNTKEIYLDKFETDDDQIFVFLGVYEGKAGDAVYKRKKVIEGMYEK